MLNRREFLRATALGAPLAAPRTGVSAPSLPEVQRYVELGGTGLKVSDVSFGSSRVSEPAVVRHAFARGINFFDSAESYRGGDAEEAIGIALKGKRDQVVLTSKHRAWAGESEARMMEALEGSLRRLQTDYIDIYFNHAVNDVGRLKNPHWLSFTERAKREGKIRFVGVSGHGAALAECLEYAIDKALVDVVLAAHNFGQDPKIYDHLRHTFHFVALQPKLPPVLAKAKDKKIGVIAMKTLLGARLNDMRPYEHGDATFAQSALRWVLSAGYADTLVVTMSTSDLVDEYVQASGETKLSSQHRHLLELYANLQRGRYCHPGCDACAQSCPENVAISEVLRTRMYDVDYGDREFARAGYAALGPGAAACLTCRVQSCLGACPMQVPIADLTRDAARRFA